MAAVTTSLPEALRGTRNWDYRYTWMRDAAFTLYALQRIGFTEEAEAYALTLCLLVCLCLLCMPTETASDAPPHNHTTYADRLMTPR